MNIYFDFDNDPSCRHSMLSASKAKIVIYTAWSACFTFFNQEPDHWMTNTHAMTFSLFSAALFDTLTHPRQNVKWLGSDGTVAE